MNSKENTRYHNLSVLTEQGFKKYSNTTVFQREAISIISPSVAENIAGGYWFDLRKVNLDRLSSKAFLLVRIVPNLFVFCPLYAISDLLKGELMDNRPHSGDVWGIGMKLNFQANKVKLFNRKDSRRFVQLDLSNSESIVPLLENIDE